MHQSWSPLQGVMTIDQFSYIRIQPKTIDLSRRLWGINPTNSVVILKFFREYQTAKLRDSGASKGTQRVRNRENEPFEILTGSFDRNPLHSKTAGQELTNVARMKMDLFKI